MFCNPTFLFEYHIDHTFTRSDHSGTLTLPDLKRKSTINIKLKFYYKKSQQNIKNLYIYIYIFKTIVIFSLTSSGSWQKPW